MPRPAVVILILMVGLMGALATSLGLKLTHLKRTVPPAPVAQTLPPGCKPQSVLYMDASGHTTPLPDTAVCPFNPARRYAPE